MTKRIQFNDYEVGATIPELQQGPIHHMDLVRYAGASGDFNPIHTDPAFAKSVGLPGTIVHGMYAMAQLGRLVSNWASLSQWKSFNVKFKGMVLPGDTLTCHGKVKHKKEVDGKKLLTLSIEARVFDKVQVVGEAVILCD